MRNILTLPLAQTDATDATTAAPGTAAPDPGAAGKPRDGLSELLLSPIFPLVLIMVVVYGFVISGNRRKDREKKEQLAALARGDRVTTIGGIIGTVVDAGGDSNEVVLKIDETNNTKMKITRVAVATVSKSKADKN